MTIPFSAHLGSDILLWVAPPSLPPSSFLQMSSFLCLSSNILGQDAATVAPQTDVLTLFLPQPTQDRHPHTLFVF
jgi:hypothetical protein